jgi:hypothetical protein
VKFLVVPSVKEREEEMARECEKEGYHLLEILLALIFQICKCL